MSKFKLDGSYKKTINRADAKVEPVGYCHCKLHKGFLLVKHVKKHECIEKGCIWFECNTEHPYFAELNSNVIRKHLGKRIGKAYRSDLISRKKRDELSHTVQKCDIYNLEHKLSAEDLELICYNEIVQKYSLRG